MKYIYSSKNRLDDPHSYMYSKFAGRDLLEAYRESRLTVLRQLSNSGAPDPSEQEQSRRDAGLLQSAQAALGEHLKAMGAGERFESLLDTGRTGVREMDAEDTPGRNMPSEEAAGSAFVETATLLHNLSERLTISPADAEVKRQLDGMLHRFEISKKLYHRYDSNFRNGEGGARDARLYWLLSLALLLHFLHGGQMKYASTMLKATDLLCSLPEEQLRREIEEGGLTLLLAAEVACVEKLIQNQGAHAAR